MNELSFKELVEVRDTQLEINVDEIMRRISLNFVRCLMDLLMPSKYEELFDQMSLLKSRLCKYEDRLAKIRRMISEF